MVTNDNLESTLFSWLHIYYALLASVRFEHSVCRGSLMIIFIMLFAKLVEQSLVHWCQQCVTVHHVSKCMSYHKAIVVITGRAHCFNDCIYIMLILHLCDLSTLSWITYDRPSTYYIYTYIAFVGYVLNLWNVVFWWKKTALKCFSLFGLNTTHLFHLLYHHQLSFF